MGKSLEEMCRLVTGAGAWHIGNIHVSDGPHGVRAQEDGAKNNDSYEATCFPTASSTACSWNRELIGKMAEGMACEAKELGVSVVLGPGINVKRSPLCGRNFEYYSEDPFLAGELAVAYICAMQTNGVGTSLKHFAGNSQETHRMTSNSMIDERALHEIYLSAFEKTVKCAKPATVMASYNYLNGVPACENSELLTDILRKQWGYEGLVMSDWGACVDLPACIAAGMDVEMPDSCGNHFNELLEAAKKNSRLEQALRDAAYRIEKLIAAYGKNRIEKKEVKCVSEQTRNHNHELARRIEEESAVLLKNDSFFPLKNIREILLIGDLADKPRIQGGGSSHIHTDRVDNFIEEFEKQHIKVHFARGYRSNTFHRDSRLEKEQKDKLSLKDMFHIFARNDQLVASGLASIFFNITNNILIVFGVNFFYTEYGYSESGTLVFYFTVMYGLGMLISQASYAGLAKRFSREKILKVCFIVLLIGYACFMAFGYVLPKNVILLNAIGFVIFFFQGLMNLAIVVMINNTIEYDEARFHERHDSVISAVRSFSVKLAGGINQGLSTLVLIVSGVYAKSQSISALEIEVNKGNLSSEEVLAEANKYISEITAQQVLIFRIGMVLIPVVALIISYVIIKKKYHIDEAEYARLIREK